MLVLRKQEWKHSGCRLRNVCCYFLYISKWRKFCAL